VASQQIYMIKLIKIITAVFFVLIPLSVITFIFMKVPDIPMDKLKDQYAYSPSQFININGHNVHYRREGQGETVMLLHGTGSSLHTWEPWVHHLQDSFEVITLDLPAFGLTGPNKDHDYTTESYNQFLLDFTEAIGVDHFHLAGNSLGGRIAWNFTLDHPNRVNKLILIAAAGFPRESPALFKLIRNPILGPIFRHITAKSLVRDNLEEVYYQDDKVTDAIVDRYYHMGLREGNRDAMLARVKTNYTNRIDEINQINHHTLLMWGEQDPWVPFEDAQKFNQAIKNSRIVSYADSGHVPMEEVPERSVEDAMSFLLSDK